MKAPARPIRPSAMARSCRWHRSQVCDLKPYPLIRCEPVSLAPRTIKIDRSTVGHRNEAAPCLIDLPFHHATIRQTSSTFGIAVRRIQIVAVRPFCHAARTLEKSADIRLPKNERAARICPFVPADVSRPRTICGDFDRLSHNGSLCVVRRHRTRNRPVVLQEQQSQSCDPDHHCTLAAAVRFFRDAVGWRKTSVISRRLSPHTAPT